MPRPAIRLLLDVSRPADGRLEGRIRADGTDAWKSFSGVLELLKAIEETLTAVESAAHNPAKEGPSHDVQD